MSLLYEELPSQPSSSTGNQEDSLHGELRSLFLNDDNGNETFYGFENPKTPDLETIFSTESDDEEFYGFEAPNLETIFSAESDSDEFYGF